jgi:hypothetical protein
VVLFRNTVTYKAIFDRMDRIHRMLLNLVHPALKIGERRTPHPCPSPPGEGEISPLFS